MGSPARIILILLLWAPLAPGFSQTKETDMIHEFAKAKPEYSPVPIWWWSGDPITREGIREQVGRFAEGGIHNVIILNLAPSGALYGSAADDPPFLSEAWWDLFGFALDEAKKAGVRLWFYDQLGFSGASLQARVVREHPEFRGISLHREIRDITGPGEVEIKCPPAGEPLRAFVTQWAQRSRQAAHWIWDATDHKTAEKRFFRRAFQLDAQPGEAHVNITCDNGYVLFVNGQKIGEQDARDGNAWRSAKRYDVTSPLVAGKNVLAVEAENTAGPAGLLVELVWREKGPDATAANATTTNAPRILSSDTAFRVFASAPEGWTARDFDDSAWPAATSRGQAPCTPWGAVDGLETLPQWPYGAPMRKVFDISSSIQDRAVQVRVASGQHRVALYYTMPGGFDYHNPDAASALLAIVHGEMERRFPDELGETIAGSFQDEFPSVPRFSRRLIEQFKARNGYDLLDCLPALYDDVVDGFGKPDSPSTAQIRCAANDLAAALAEEAFFIPLYKWHEKYGMLCGYDQTVRNADPIRGEDYYVDYFKTMRHYSVPGNDMDGDEKPHQSIADLYGRPRVWIEAFHSSGWGQTLEEIAVLLHPWMADGATLFNPHAIYYSIHGSYWEWAPPDTGWRQPYYTHYPVLADYTARLCDVLSKGSRVVEIGLLHPASTIHAGRGYADPSPAATRAQRAYWDAQHALRTERIDYLILDEDSLATGQVVKKGKTLVVANMPLRAVILPSTLVVRTETLKVLSDFADAGGAVFILGDAPAVRADGNKGGAAPEFARHADILKSRAVAIDGPDDVIAKIARVVPRDVREKMPFLHRKIGDRDFYLLLSDDGTPATAGARFDINKRKLWETAAGQGESFATTLRAAGVPEVWSALTGQVVPVYNYQRESGATRMEVGLDDTPAPLVALRPPLEGDPIAIDADFRVEAVEREGDLIRVKGIPWRNRGATAGESGGHRVRLTYSDAAVFEGIAKASSSTTLTLEGPFECRLEPTCDNRDGSFAWPPSQGPIPVEIRQFRFMEEDATGSTGATVAAKPADPAKYADPSVDDSKWPVVVASFGPRADVAGPLSLGAGASFDAIATPPAATGFRAAEYSLRLGILNDPMFAAALGGKGRIPEDFLNLGDVKGGDAYLVRADVAPPAETTAPVGALLRVGAIARKRVFLNGKLVELDGPPEANVLRAPIELQPGPNRLEILVARRDDGPLRLYYQILPPAGAPPDAEWIWSEKADPSGYSTFTRKFLVPGEVKSAMMTLALGELHRIRVNGKLVSDQGGFDAYFMGRADRHDLKPFLQNGENTISIEARDTGSPVGMLLDAWIILSTGKQIVVVSDPSFTTGDGRPARVLPSPAHRYFGEWSALLNRPRPHPLPQAGWLVDEPARPAPFDRLAYSAPGSKAKPGWYRFLLPPGATALTLQSPGSARLFVDGRETAIAREGDGAWKAALPGADSPRRVAALRIESAPGFERGAAILEPIRFEVGPGRIALGPWHELGLPHYSGGVRYSKEVSLPGDPIQGKRTYVDLGRVRGTAEVIVNGTNCGTRIWHPYRYDITAAVKAGSNQIEVRVFNTLGPHFDVGHPSGHVFENHSVSGIIGPVRVEAVAPVEIEARRK